MGKRNDMTQTLRCAKGLSCFAAVIALLLFISACQPTPEQPVVVNKNDGKLEEKLQETQPPEKTAVPYSAPAHWSETVSCGGFTINIDTDIELPDTDKYPVVKLERDSFTQQRIDELVRYFAGDKKLYAWPSVFTKADYTEQIIDAKRGQEVDGEYVVTEETEELVKELEKKYETAPDNSPRVYIDTRLTYDTDVEGIVNYDRGQNFLSAGVENGQGSDAVINVCNYVKGETTGTAFSYARCNGYISESWYNESPDESETGWKGYGKMLNDITLDKNAAQAQADKIISDLGIKDVMLINAEKAVLNSWNNLWGISSDRPDKGGYIFEYMRGDGGLLGFQLNSWSGSREDRPPDYSPPFYQESIEIAVSDEGIESFRWSGCAKVIEIVNENVELLPFDKIQQRLKDQIRYKKSTGLGGYDMEDYVVTVTSAKLRAGYIGIKDNPDQALMVPMWVFETELSYYNNVLKKQQRYKDDTFMFNAIDGGVIEMRVPDMP